MNVSATKTSKRLDVNLDSNMVFVKNYKCV